MLDYENSINPFVDRRESIESLRSIAQTHVNETKTIISKANELTSLSNLSKPIWLTTGLPHPALSRRESVPPPSPSGGRAGDEGLRRQLNEGKLRDITYWYAMKCSVVG